MTFSKWLMVALSAGALACSSSKADYGDTSVAASSGTGSTGTSTGAAISGGATNEASTSNTTAAVGPVTASATGAMGTTGLATSAATSQGTVGGVTAGAVTSTAGAATSTTGAASGAGGASSTSATVNSTGSAPTGPCRMPEVRVTDVSLDVSVIGNGGQGDTQPIPLALAAKPSGGTTLVWMSDDGAVHIANLDVDDQMVGSSFSLPANDFQDVHADDNGGVVLLTRDAEGGGTLNCGQPSNLCDGGPNPAIPCHDMFLVRFDNGSESWATKLTTSSSSLPPYSTGPGGPTVNMIWWYQHHGRIAFDGSNYASYFGNAISISEGGCINIHQGDRTQVVDTSGQIVDHPNASGGCSHSWTTRILWDERAGEFVRVCATDNSNRIARPGPYRTIVPVSDIGGAAVGGLVNATSSGYWISANADGDLRLVRFTEAEPEQDINVAESDFSHLVEYGASNMIVAWSSGSGMTAQVRDRGDGSLVADNFDIDVPDHRYQAFKSFPDGSAAFAGQGSGGQSVRIARVMPCEG